MTAREALMEKAVARLQLSSRELLSHPWHAVRDGLVLTLDEKPPAGVPAVRPLPADPYIEAVIGLWLSTPRGLLAKSRQMLVSWLFSWLLLWDAIAHPARHCVVQGKRLEDVDAKNPHHILGRIRHIRQHLPPALQPRVLREDTTSETYANGSTIEAIPEGEAIVRGKVPSNMWMDEICFQETAEANWNAANPSAARLWGVSTPNGHDFLYRQAEAGRAWDDWRRWPSVMPGLHGYVNSRGIQLAFLHYSADELRRTVEWQLRARNGYTSLRDYLREQEGDFTLTAGRPVYGNEFSKDRHVLEHYQVDPLAPICCGWDFGYNGTACLMAQHNSAGQLVVFDAVITRGVALPRVALEVNRRLAQYAQREALTDGGLYAAGTPVDHYGDPSAEAQNTHGETDQQVLSKYNILLKTRPTTGRKRALVDQVRQLLLPRADGKPALVVAKNSASMDVIIAALAGGYAYPEVLEGRADKEVPHKDGVYDHPMDALQYLVDWVDPMQYGHRAPAEPDWWRIDDPGVGTDAYEM